MLRSHIIIEVADPGLGKPDIRIVVDIIQHILNMRINDLIPVFVVQLLPEQARVIPQLIPVLFHWLIICRRHFFQKVKYIIERINRHVKQLILHILVFLILKIVFFIEFFKIVEDHIAAGHSPTGQMLTIVWILPG